MYQIRSNFKFLGQPTPFQSQFLVLKIKSTSIFNLPIDLCYVFLLYTQYRNSQMHLTFCTKNGRKMLFMVQKENIFLFEDI